MYEIWIQYTNVFKRYRPETIFHSKIEGHNSDNNWWILSIIELDLNFMSIYLCMKYESNTPMFSKDIARKPFFVRTGRTYVRMYVRTYVRTYRQGWCYMPPPIINGGGIKNIRTFNRKWMRELLNNPTLPAMDHNVPVEPDYLWPYSCPFTYFLYFEVALMLTEIF